jgi:hypothetical protein
MGCTITEWLDWFPAAMCDVPWQQTEGRVTAQLGSGALSIEWHAGEPRRIALFQIPRLHVRFEFASLDDAQRYTFMKRFDFYMQRGGG